MIEKRKRPTRIPRRRKPIRHTHASLAAIEDAIAILWDVLDDAACSILRLQSKAKRALDIMKILRMGPHAYPLDRPGKEDHDCKRH